MSLFRSDQMGYYTLIGSWEYSWEILNTLGEIDCLQFVDLNNQETSFNRPFSNYVRRCEDLENKINTLDAYLKRFNIQSQHCENPREFLANLKYTLATRGKDERTYLDDVEAEVNDRISTLNDQIKNYEDLLDNYDHLVEYRQVLKLTRPYIGGGMGGGAFQGEFGGDMRRDIQFTYLTGVINKEDSLRFKRILFRITRGMTWTAMLDMERTSSNIERPGLHNIGDNEKKEEKPKMAFIIVYQGGQHGMLKDKLRRVCESFGASQYGVPENTAAFDRKIFEIEAQLNDAQEVVRNTKKHIDTILYELTRPSRDDFRYSHLDGLRLFIVKEKTLYHNLNMLAPQQALFRANCWCPTDRVPEVEGALQNLVRARSGMGGYEFHESRAPKGVSPPTCFRTNEVTQYFQEIVNTYGVPRYREINPGLFTIATFPFLFGVMFGDILHGGLLFVFGIYLCWWKTSIEKNKGMMASILPLRYIFLLQGLFAFYAGWIYNDFTSIPLKISSSCYDHDKVNVDGTLTKISDCNYEFGMDPNWFHTSNELTFQNSFKMKLSIILGVTQMLFGIVLRGLNSIHFRKWLDFFFEFIPMLLFLSLTFGYMVFLIIMKWLIPWSENPADEYPIAKAPSIIGIFIKMVLSPGSWDESQMGVALYGDIHGGFQSKLQLVFLLVAVACALLILVPKPVILYMQSKKHGKHPAHRGQDYSMQANLLENSMDDNRRLIEPTPTPEQRKVTQAGDDEGEEHHDMGEIVVHQIIETIEFVLGSVSNTASYLRLWALSLAHSQLAKVFFDKTLAGAVENGNPIVAFVGFWIFANITLGVLMLMDQMECFLHALRLHWVEFQNKFYKADGYNFTPFSFEKSLKEAQQSN